MDVGGVKNATLELMLARVAINNLKTVQDIQKQVLQLIPGAEEVARESNAVVNNQNAQVVEEGTKGRLVNTFA